MSDVKELIAKQQIYQVLCEYCRGLDRMDKQMAHSVWHDDATVLYHNMFAGSANEFVQWVWGAHSNMQRHSHQIANSLIYVDGEKARSETYVTVELWRNPREGEKQQQIVCKGRYLDQWSKRDEKWAISYREFVLDMQSSRDLQNSSFSEVSKRDTSDPSYRVLADSAG